MEELQYNLLFRWFVGLDLDAPVWDVTVFTKNRDRLLEGEVATAFFKEVLAQAKAQRLLSDEHFVLGSKKWTPSTYDPRSGGVGWNTYRDSNIRRSSGSKPCSWSWSSS
jgi:hypothetical protein